MQDSTVLRIEAVAIAARLRKEGHSDIADVVERWADARDLGGQLIELSGDGSG